MVRDFSAGNYRFIPAVFQYSSGAAADTGFEVEPSARIAWTPTEKQTVWAAVSRAVRTPAIYNLTAQVNEPMVPAPPSPVPIYFSLMPNPKLNSESLIA